MAFKKSSRLNRSSMISLVSRKGASLKSPFFRIKFLPARFGDTKIVIITAKKIEKKAVGRNKIRRRVSYCFEKHIEGGFVRSKKQFLIAVFPTAEVLSGKYEYVYLEKAVTNAIEKMKSFHFRKK